MITLIYAVSMIVCVVFTEYMHSRRMKRQEELHLMEMGYMVRTAVVAHHDRVLLSCYEVTGGKRSFRRFCEAVNAAVQIDCDNERDVGEEVEKLYKAN